jgi:Dolichyl-phosphate-mannose-protein mannosyltransferase
VLTKDAPIEIALDRPSTGAGQAQRWLAIVLVAVAGLLARWWIGSSSQGFVSGDEGMSAVSAFDVLHGQPHLLIGASNYGGTLEALVLAPLLRVFGAHVWLLRIVASAIFAIAVVAAAKAAREIFDRRISWMVGGLLWLMSGAIVLLSMTMYLGYNSGLLFMVISLGLMMRLAKDELSAWTFFAAGVSAGLAVWGHPLFVVPLMPAMVALIVLRRSDIRRWFLALAGGSVLGLSPFLAWNAMNGWASILHNPPPLVATTYRERLETVFAQLLPRAFGLRGQPGDWLYPRKLGLAAFIVLLVLIHVGLLVLARRSRAGVVVAASGLLAIPLVAAFPALFWSSDARYAIVVLVPWLMGLCVWVDMLLRRRRSAALWAGALVLVFGLLSTGKWMHRYSRVRADANGQSVAMVKALDARGVQGVIGAYWEVYRIGFFSNDRIAVHVPPEIAGPDRSTRSTNAVIALPKSKVAYVNYLPKDAVCLDKETVAGIEICFAT